MFRSPSAKFAGTTISPLCSSATYPSNGTKLRPLACEPSVPVTFLFTVTLAVRFPNKLFHTPLNHVTTLSHAAFKPSMSLSMMSLPHWTTLSKAPLIPSPILPTTSAPALTTEAITLQMPSISLPISSIPAARILGAFSISAPSRLMTISGAFSISLGSAVISPSASAMMISIAASTSI